MKCIILGIEIEVKYVLNVGEILVNMSVKRLVELCFCNFLGDIEVTAKRYEGNLRSLRVSRCRSVFATDSFFGSPFFR